MLTADIVSVKICDQEPVDFPQNGNLVYVMTFIILTTWWRHDMETLSALLALYEGNPRVTGGFPSQNANDADLNVSFDVSWTRCWTNSPMVGDLRRYNAHVTSLKWKRAVTLPVVLMPLTTHRNTMTTLTARDTTKRHCKVPTGYMPSFLCKI